MKYLGSKIIETDRLLLKPSSIEEQKYLWELMMNPEIGKYYLKGSPNKDYGILHWDQWEQFIKKDILNANNPNVFRWSVFLKGTNECIGKVSCHPACQEFENINDPNIRGVGWFIDLKYKGNGYGYEAAKAMVDYMFNECEIDEIIVEIAKDNYPSWNICEKLGFIRKNNISLVKYMFLEEDVEAYNYIISREMYNQFNNDEHKIKS